MKGRIGQRAFYDRLPAALDEAFTALGRPHRPALRPDPALPLRGRRARSSSRWGRWPTRRPRWSTTSERQGRPVGSIAVTCFRPFPAAALLAVRPRRPIDRRRRADRRAGGGRQPADARGEGGPLRARRRGDHGASHPVGLGRARLPRRRPWRPRRRLRLAGRPSRARRCAATPTVGIRHPSALPATPLDLRPRRRVQPSRPLDRRLRLGHDEQARRFARRGACSTCRSRPTRATAPRRRACRRPTTSPSPRSGSGSTRSSSRSISCRSTTWRRSARAIRCAG